MEATREEDMGLLHTIRPPKLEDAGLEDCALPLHSIHEAFLKAASAILTAEDNDGGCVSDPSSKPQSDALVGITPEVGPPSGPCAAVKGGAWVGDGDSASGDLVVVGERNEEDVEKKDDVVVIGGGGGEESGGCVDGVRDLKIKERDDGGDDDGDDKDEKKPTLVEGYFFTP